MDAEAYGDKAQNYFAHTRRDIIRVMPPGKGRRVLEVGCGRGHTLMALKQSGYAAEAVGVELVPLQRSDEEVRGVDRYIVGNIETDVLELPQNYFDVVVCGDVLEHMNDPWAVVGKLQGLLRGNGSLVASVPNVREARTLYNLLVKGDFAYTESGVLDRTHLRFFCKRNILDLLTVAGASVQNVSHDLATRNNWRAKLHRWTFGLLEQFLVTQYLVVVRKPMP
jgi:2-polyprenyl-3-methyl-5-hydroxy-6-metoxy-1,4-benzoquinol methylase